MCVFSDNSTQLNATRLHSNSEKLPESDRFLLTAMDWVRNSDAMFHCDEYNTPLPPNTPDSQFRNVICPTRSCCHRRSIHLYSRTAHGCVGSTGSDASHLQRQSKLSTPFLTSHIRRTRQSRIVLVHILMRQRNLQRPPLLLIDCQCQWGTFGWNVITPPGPHDQSLPVFVVRIPRPLDHNENGRHGQQRQRDVLSGIARDDHDLELPGGGSVPHDAVVSVGGSPGVDGRPAHGIGEHVDQVVHVFELGREPRPDDVVAAGHALDDLPGDVGVRLVGGHVEGLPGGDEEVVEEKGGHGPGVSRELLGETQDGAGAFAFPRGFLVGMDVVAGLLFLEALEEPFELAGGGLLGTRHEALEEGAEGGFLGVLVAVGEEDGQLGLVGDAGGELGVLLDEDGDLLEAAEAAHGLEGRERHGQLGLVVVVHVVGGVLQVQLLGAGLAGVGLDGQGLAGAEHLEQEGQRAAHGLFQRGAVAQRGGTGGVGAHPQLGVGRVGVHLVDDAALEGVAGDAGVEAADSPGVVLEDRAERQHVAV
mmetsp:Transcript_2121/g.4416  ORF Transcript_2121/g.4416 Transcript_2121/m.4416 type:complete len:533 (-) Transcript_2121:408-2006(-)